MAGDFPNLMKEIIILDAKFSRNPNEINTKRYTCRHITIKPLKAKERENLESNKRIITHGILENNNWLIADFSSETMEAGRQRNDIFRVLEKKEKKNLSTK